MKWIGHRGAAGLVAENTLESIAKALSYPISGIEIDVHCCKSGEVVVIHDNTLDRTTNGRGEIAEYTLTQLKKITTREGFAIPTLIEVLELIDARCQLNIELKGNGTAKPVVALLETFVQKTDWSYGDFILSGFDHRQLYEVHKLQPRFRIGVLTEENIRTVLSVAEGLNAFSIHPPILSLTRKDVKKARAKGYKVFVWTVNTKKQIEQCKLWNVDGIITDFPNFAV